LKVTTETPKDCEVLLTVEIDDRQKDKVLQKAARRIAKQVRIPGFRPGKAPYNLMVNRFGLEAIQDEAMEELTSAVFQNALKEADVTPYAMASMESIEWEPLVMKIKVPTEPVVELGNYRDLRVEFEKPEVTPEELDHELEHLKDSYATFVPMERPAEVGDLVSVTIDEKDAESGEVLSTDQSIEITLREAAEMDDEPDWATHLAGLSADDEAVFTHTFADDYPNAQYAGKTVEISASVETVKTKEEVELNDEFASLVGDFDTLDDLKAQIEEDMVARTQNEIDMDLIGTVLEQVVDGAKTIKWPAIMEEEEIYSSIDYQRKQSGLDMDSFLKTQGKTLEELQEEKRETVQKSLKTALVLSKVVELEGLQVDGTEIRQQAEWMVMLSGGSEEAAEAFASPDGLRMLANNILSDKARARLLAIAKGELEEEEEAADAEDEAEATSNDDTAAEAELDPEAETTAEADPEAEAVADQETEA